MLQRSQTLYLLGVFILSVLLLSGPLALFTEEGSGYMLKSSGVLNYQGEKLGIATWPISLFFTLVSVLAFINIFLYRKRVLQMRICIFLIFLSAGMIGMIFYYVAVVRAQLENASVLYQWRIVLPLIIAILLYLAFRRIRRDELLVKAYDRIR